MSATDTRAAAKARQSEHGGTYRQALAFVMAVRAADTWNSLYPVGTPCTVQVVRGGAKTETRTRSVAWAHASGQASVLVEGKSGSYGLAWVKPVKVSP